MDPWPDDVPNWLKTWEGPPTKGEWAFKNRVLLYRYALELLKRGPVITGPGKGRITSPQGIMTNTARHFSLTRLKKHLKGYADNPVHVLPKSKKTPTATKKPTPEEQPQLTLLTTISQPTIEGRVRAAISDGTDSGSVPDPGLLSHRDPGQRDSREADGPPVPADDDCFHEDLETDDMGPDWDLPGTAEERGD